MDTNRFEIFGDTLFLLSPSSGKSGEVSNYLVGPITWRTSFTLGTICNTGPNRKCALLHILSGGAGREYL